MAHVKNSVRSKRKYGDKRTSATARNKQNKQTRHELRMERFKERTAALVGQRVRTGNQEGTVLQAEKIEGRRGTTLTIALQDRQVLRSRRSVRPI